MIIYLHGFDSNSPGNHEKIMQLKFIDDDVRFINYSTLHPRYDMQFLLNEVHKLVSESNDKTPLICGVGLGGSALAFCAVSSRQFLTRICSLMKICKAE